MFSFKVLIAAAALICVSARHIVFEDESRYYVLPIEALEDLEDDGELVPTRVGRMRRQIHGSGTINSDGTSGANLQIPLAGNDQNRLSAIGAVNLDKDFGVARSTAGLSLDNVNGHGLTLTKSFMPKADQLAAAGHVNLFENKNHQVDANAFVARTMPKSSFPDFNTYGGGVDYMYKNKVGAGVNVAHTPMFDKTDYGATGKLNLFRNRDTSLDFNAGLSKSVSPYIPKSSWEPSYGFSFKKWF